MPLPLAPIITAGAGLIGQGLGAILDKSASDRQYKRQKQDNLEFWNMQNSYNSPQAQMQRLQQAGLNPNLVYGGNTVGNASAQVQTPHANPYQPSKATNFAQIADTYFNVQTQQQALDNAKQQGNLMVADGLLKASQLEKQNLENSFLRSTLFDRTMKIGYDRQSAGNKIITDALQTMFLTGYSSPSLNLPDGKTIGIGKESRYSKELQGLDLINMLRRSQGNLQNDTSDINKIRKQYLGRTMSGKFSDMSAKDWLTLLIQGAGLFK